MAPQLLKTFSLKPSALVVLLLAVVAVLLSRCGSSNPEEEPDASSETEEEWFLNLHDSVRYVGMNTCRKCHEDIYQSFSQTGMGQSFGVATPTKSAGDFSSHQPVYDSHRDFYYYPYWEGEELLLMEYRLEDGDTVHKRVEKIDYIIGSGQHTNSHIYSENGYLHQAPLTFYVQDRKWDLPPGYEDGANSRFSRIIGAECMTCHNGLPEFDYRSENKFISVPTGIDCERCHGPGSLHVQEKLAGKVVDTRHDTDWTIVNPRKLPLTLQIDVCQRCHLQGNAVLKEGKNWHDFQPGMELTDVMDVFVPQYANEEEHFIMASHAERMKMSPCFTESQDHPQLTGMTCITCHNPHRSVTVTAEEHFTTACMDCHAQEPLHGCTMPKAKRLEANNNDCISCHMPRSGTVDIPHVNITDHYIRIPEEEKPAALPQEPKIVGLRNSLRPNADAATMAKGYLYYYEKFKRLPFLLDSAASYLNQVKPQAPAALWVQYYFLQNDWAGVVKAAQDQQEGFDARTFYRIGQAFDHTNQPASAISFYAKAVEKEPFNLDYHNKLGAALLLVGDTAQARVEFAFILSQNENMVPAVNNIGFLNLLSGNAEQAQQQFERALQLDPDYWHAQVNLLKLYIVEQRLAKARALGAKLQAEQPQNQEVQQLLALLNAAQVQ